MIKRKVSLIKYWLRVTIDWDTPDLVKDAYALALSESLQWVKCINASYPQAWSQPASLNSNEFS